ncbi:MAG: L,D-transpeptidase family protein [Verrucomicrobiales bacterium]|nr:L,D-transpeptidase family protein [Verrucomicrobiales bacterium]
MKHRLLIAWPTLCFALTCLLALSSCTVSDTGQIVLGPTTTAGRKQPFATSGNSQRVKSPAPAQVPQHYRFVDDDLLPELNPGNARIQIDLGEQRARIFRGNDLVIETQISTGKQGHNTPSGSYKILEKSQTKRSNLYGRWVDGKSGSILVSDGDSRKPPRSPNAEFVGTPMPYWLRITPGGVGMHVGYVPDFPASHGCIRVPQAMQPLIFEKVGVGTPVTITH